MGRIALFFMLLTVLLLGCNSVQNEEIKSVIENIQQGSEKKPKYIEEPLTNSILPVKLEGQSFQSVVEWYTSEEVLYIVPDEGRTKVFKHHLYDGHNELFFETSEQIITLQSSPSQKTFVIHASSSSNQAKLIIVDKNGNELYGWEVESAEIQYVWNPFDENQLFITSFSEDWSFNNYVLKIKEQTVEENDLPYPFIQWMSPTDVAFLKWEENGSDAPLFISNLKGEKEKGIKEHVIALQTYPDLLMIISISNETYFYEFFNPTTMKKINEFTIPVVETHSDSWWVPHFDYHSETSKFYFFKPIIENGVMKSLDLVSYSILTGEEEIILTKTEDQPISISMDGNKLLLGYQYNTIMEIQSKKIFNLIQQ